MDHLLLDLRLAFRRLRQNPGFTVVAVLTLALGIGANTAVFNVINAILLRPLPGVDPQAQLVSFNFQMGENNYPTLSYPNYRDIRDRNTTFDGVFAYRISPLSLGVKGNARRAWGYLVTGNYFETLGVKPAAGRLLTPDDDRNPGGHPVAVLSHAAWTKWFGADPAIAGREVTLNGRVFTILGATPAAFRGTELFFAPDIFAPIMMQKEMEGGSGWLEARGTANSFVAGQRMKPGVGVEQADANLRSIAQQLAEEHPKDNAGLRLTLSPTGLAGNFIRGPIIGFAAALFGVSALVLLLACTNLTSMLLARAAEQKKETAIRLALGAGRARLVRQLLTENLVVALLGAGAGALVALWIQAGMNAWRPPTEIPLVVAASTDTRMFGFAFLISVLATLLFGLAPALAATRPNLVPALKNESGVEKQGGWKIRDLLVAAQVGISALLLVCSVLVLRSLQRALEAPIGFQPAGVIAASYDVNLQGYDERRGREFHRRLLERVRALPGVEAAGLVEQMPLSLGLSSDTVYIEGKPVPKATEAPNAYTYTVSSDYFRTMRTRIDAGREFDTRDKEGGTRVAVVNQAFAAQLLPGEDPLGRRFRTNPEGQPIEIVGVAQDGKYFALSESRKAAYFVPLEIQYSPNATLVVRTAGGSTVKSKGDPGLDGGGADTLHQVRRTVADLDPALPLSEAGPLIERMALPLFPARLAAAALTAFGLVALALSAVGIYGVMAYAVSRRTREIGIRIAIGATQGAILGMVARRAALLIGSGTLLGLAGALAGGRMLAQILYGVDASDPLTYAIVLGLMGAIAMAACWAPARRAIRVNPIQALRQE